MPLGHDYRSKIKAESDYAAITKAVWVTQKAGQFPFDHDIDINSISGNANAMTMRIRIRAAYLHDALPYIKGWAYRNNTTIPPPGGTSALNRYLPMQIIMDRTATDTKTQWGMRAVDYNYTFEGMTGAHGSAMADQMWIPVDYDDDTIFDPDGRKLTPDGSQPFGNPPTSPDEPIGRYEWAIITVTFAHLPYDVSTDVDIGGSAIGERDRYTTGIFASGVEYNTLQQGMIYWSNTTAANPALPTSGFNPGKAIGAFGGLVVPTGSISVTWHRVPGAETSGGLDAIKDCLDQIELTMGKVNDADFKLPIFKSFRTYPKGTLLLMPQSSPPIIRLSPTGIIEADITFNFFYRPNTWNKLMTPFGNFEPICLGDPAVAPTTQPYQSKPFANLFLG